MTSLDLRPAFGPLSGGTALFILHHRDFGAAHDVLVGKARLNCSLVPRGAGTAEDTTTASRCCCTPPVANETTLPLSIIHRSGHTVRPTHASFAFYRSPSLLWLSPQRVPVSAGSVPIVFAVVDWPSTEINGGRDHLARCRFAGADRGDKHKLVVVSAVIVARSDSWRFKRPSNENETWLQCKTPDLLSKAGGLLASGARGRGGDVLTAWISPNGVDFLHEGLPVDVHAVPSFARWHKSKAILTRPAACHPRGGRSRSRCPDSRKTWRLLTPMPPRRPLMRTRTSKRIASCPPRGDVPRAAGRGDLRWNLRRRETPTAH